MEGRQREAVIIWQGACGSPPPGGRAHGYKGIGGSPPPYKRNVKGGLPTMPLYGWGRGGICPRSAFPLAYCLLFIDIVFMVLFFACCYFSSSAHLVLKQALRGTVARGLQGG